MILKPPPHSVRWILVSLVSSHELGDNVFYAATFYVRCTLYINITLLHLHNGRLSTPGLGHLRSACHSGLDGVRIEESQVAEIGRT